MCFVNGLPDGIEKQIHLHKHKQTNSETDKYNHISKEN